MSVIPTEWFRGFIQQQEHMNIWKVIDLRRQYIKSIPRWRRPLVGYLSAIPILFVFLFIAVFLQQLLHRFIFPATFLLLAILLVSLVWGVGPALLMLLIGIIVLNYYFTPILAQFPLMKEGDMMQVLPVFAIGLIILLVVRQREHAYIKIQADEQELERYAHELETMNTRLEEANREKDGFLSIASHELKTPIATIRGQSQLLLRRLVKRSTPLDVSEVEAACKSINEQTTRLTSLIDELLDVNHLHSNQAVLSKSYYDLNQLCRKVIEDQRLLTGRDIVFYPSSEPLELHIDVNRIMQTVINLVSNALKYSPEDKPVEVRVSRGDQSALLHVQDHGHGISPDELPHIFEMFYRTAGARSSTTPGLGLGLAISRDIIDQHQGRIWCESELGVGANFFVELPLKSMDTQI